MTALTYEAALPITEQECKHIDEAINFMVLNIDRLNLEIDEPIWNRLQYNADACAKVDALIAPAFANLRAKKIDDFAEKLLDRLTYRSIVMDEHSRSLGILGTRVLDDMECIVALKGKYRGKPCTSSVYNKTTANENLRKRGLLK